MVLYIYIILFSYLSLYAVLKDKFGDEQMLLLYLLLALLATFRPETMNDYFEYYKFFLGVENEKFEFGFQWIVSFFREFIKSPYFYFALFAFVTIGFRLYYLKNFAQFLSLSVLVYAANIYLLHDMIQIRAAIASVALLWSTVYIYKKKLKQFILIILIASMFHYSSLAIIPLYLLNCEKKNLWMYYLLPISYLCYFLGIKLGMIVQYIPIEPIQKLYEFYIHSTVLRDEEVNVFNLLHLLRCLLFYFLIFNDKLLIHQNKYYILYVKIYLLSLASLILLSDIPTLAFRLSELFQVIEIVLLPLFVYLFKSHYIGRIFVVTIAILISFVNISHVHLLS